MNYDAILIGQAGLGAGDMKLGGLILANFLRLLGEREDKPDYIVLWNEGVRITVEGSNWIEHLKLLEQQGVKIICCRTCVEYLGLEDQIAVGEIGNMPGIQEILFTKRVLTV
jgi:intracellular sulfur oxidation DsrE/DsrF family protein